MRYYIFILGLFVLFLSFSSCGKRADEVHVYYNNDSTKSNHNECCSNKSCCADSCDVK